MSCRVNRCPDYQILIHDPAATQERIETPRVLNVIGVTTSPQGFYRTMGDRDYDGLLLIAPLEKG